MRRFKEFQIGKLFSRKTTNTYKGFNAESLVSLNGNVPVVVNSSRNNGVVGYSLLSANNDKNVITFSDTVNSDETLFYQADDFIGFSHVNKLVPKYKNFNKYQALYVIVAIKKSIQGRYDYATKFTEDIEKTVIKLPVSLRDSLEPDWDYMESFIKEITIKYLENIRHQGEVITSKIKDTQSGISQILGIEDFSLSEEDKKILKEYSSLQMERFKMKYIFKFSETKAKINGNTIDNFEGKYPYVTRSEKNNGIQGYITYPEQYLNSGNTISLGMDTATFFYQKDDYFTGDKIKILSLKNDPERLETVHPFLITVLKKTFSKFGWGTDSYSNNSLQEVYINLPSRNNKPDFDIMEKISKIMIKKSLSNYEQEIARHEQEIARHEQEIARTIGSFLEKL